MRIHPSLAGWLLSLALASACTDAAKDDVQSAVTTLAVSASGSGGSAPTTGGSGASTATGGSAGQGGQAPSLSRFTVDLLDWVEQAIGALPGKESEGFNEPDSSARATFRLAAEALKEGDLSTAQNKAAQVDYQLVELIDSATSGPFFYALLPVDWTATQVAGGAGRGLFFLRKMEDTQKAVALSSPHPRFDSYSGLVATKAFRDLAARSLAIAGTHRCANIKESGCSGTTTVCGHSTYRESDMAHTERGFFQVFHEVMDSDQTASIQHIQVHGFSSQANDPEFSLSAGTGQDYDNANFFPNRLATILAAKVSKSGSIKAGNSCNQPGDINRLCGGTNTQGRFTNGVDASKVCTESSNGQASGRFLHAELSKAMRDPNGSIGPQPFIDGLLEAL